MPKDSETAIVLIAALDLLECLVNAQSWKYRVMAFILSRKESSNSVKFSTISRSREGSQVPLMTVSKLTRPSSSSLFIFFHSLKCSNAEVSVPTLLSMPLEMIIKRYTKKSVESYLYNPGCFADRHCEDFCVTL